MKAIVIALELLCYSTVAVLIGGVIAVAMGV
jgi:hypothetical protein